VGKAFCDGRIGETSLSEHHDVIDVMPT
jgi:hypothetical protein